MAPTLANWLLAGVVLVKTPRSGQLLGVFWLLLIGLVALGTVSLATLCAMGPTTHWGAYIIKHKLLFLNLLPPFAIAATVAPFTALRPALAEFILGNHPAFAILRWVLPVALTLALIVWWFAGNAQGVAGFQPVEAGKFATAIMVGALLVQWRRSEQRRAAAFRWSNRFFFVVTKHQPSLLYCLPSRIFAATIRP